MAASRKISRPRRPENIIVIQKCMVGLLMSKNQVTAILMKAPTNTTDHKGIGRPATTLFRGFAAIPRFGQTPGRFPHTAFSGPRSSVQNWPSVSEEPPVCRRRSAGRSLAAVAATRHRSLDARIRAGLPEVPSASGQENCSHFCIAPLARKLPRRPSRPGPSRPAMSRPGASPA